MSTHDIPSGTVPPAKDGSPEAPQPGATSTVEAALNPDPASQSAPGAPPPEAAFVTASEREAALQAELAEMRDRWMRSEAEIANVRARARREVDETRQYAVQKFARDVVEAAENIKRGLDSLPPPRDDEAEIVAKLREGFASVERNFVSVLERNGIQAQDPTGATFDPNLHQAMAEQETLEHPPGTVIQAWTLAWTLNGRLLRPAMVVVAKAPPAELNAPGSPA